MKSEINLTPGRRKTRCRLCGEQTEVVRTPTKLVVIDPNPNPNGEVFFIAGFAICGKQTAPYTLLELYSLHRCRKSVPKRGAP